MRVGVTALNIFEMMMNEMYFYLSTISSLVQIGMEVYISHQVECLLCYQPTLCIEIATL